MEEKEKKDELSIKHKLSQPERPVCAHALENNHFATKLLSDSKQAFVSTQSPKCGLACMLAQLNSTSRLHSVMKKTHWLERGNKQAVAELK
jgi:hypothetical protein